MVNANGNRAQTETDRRDAARRIWSGAIRNKTVGGIGGIPEIIETRLLNVIEKIIIAGKGMRQNGERERRWALLRVRSHCGDSIIIGHSVTDAEVTKRGLR